MDQKALINSVKHRKLHITIACGFNIEIKLNPYQKDCFILSEIDYLRNLK